MRRVTRLLALSIVFACAGPPRPAPTDSARIALGPVAGDVRVGSAVLWARASGPGTLAFELDPPDALIAPVRVHAARDFTARVRIAGLRPATHYEVRVRGGAGEPATGRFETPAEPTAASPVRLAWGGDLAGQNVCRDAQAGFAIFGALVRLAPQVFVGLGDMIYADDVCESRGRYGNAQRPGDFFAAADLPAWWAHWRYAREDPGQAELLARTSYVAVWDDHEVVNDSGPLNPKSPELMPLGLRAFLDYNPVSSDSRETPERLYRALRLGKHVELFVLDTRQYRDANRAPDAPPAAPKSMLGREQLTWLRESLAGSNATWKVIVSSVPLGVATGFPAANGRDGWSGVDQDTGFGRERDEILRFMAERGIATSIWLTTDVHYAEVFAHRPFADRPEFRVIEAISGPMNAGVQTPQPIDPSLRSEIRFLHAPSAESPIETWEQALRYFNFGALEVAESGELTLRIIGVTGESLYEERFAPPSH